MKTTALVIAFCTSAICGHTATNLSNLSEHTVQQKVLFSDPDLSTFRTHRQGKGVSVNWGLTSSEGVSGFVVERSYGDPGDPYAMWENVTSVPCNSSRSYKYTDENTFPGFVNYRIVIVMNNGTKKVSAVSTVHVVSRHG